MSAAEVWAKINFENQHEPTCIVNSHQQRDVDDTIKMSPHTRNNKSKTFNIFRALFCWCLIIIPFEHLNVLNVLNV